MTEDEINAVLSRLQFSEPEAEAPRSRLSEVSLSRPSIDESFPVSFSPSRGNISPMASGAMSVMPSATGRASVPAFGGELSVQGGYLPIRGASPMTHHGFSFEKRFADGGEVPHKANGGISYSGDFSTPDYYQVYNALPNAGFAGQFVQRMFPNPSTTGAYDAYMKQLASNASAPAAPMQPYLAAARPVVDPVVAPFAAATPPASMMPANNFNLAQFNSAPNTQQLALAPPKMVQPETMAHGGEVDAALHAVRHHLAGGGFLSDLFSGPDYLSNSEVASFANMPTQDETNADFFKADRALRLAREVQAPMTSSVPDRAPLTAPRPGPVEVQELPVNIPFAAPDRGVSMLSSDISPASVTSLPLAYAPAPTQAPAANAIDQATGKMTARIPDEPHGTALTKQQADYVIRTIAAETSGKSPEETQAIASVILNRINSGKYGSSPEAVLFAKRQFEPWMNPAGKNYPMKISPTSQRYVDAREALEAAMAGEDITRGATNFWGPKSQYSLGRDTPDWAVKMPDYTDIGATRFHRPNKRAEGGEVEGYDKGGEILKMARGILAKSAPRKVVTDPAERAVNLAKMMSRSAIKNTQTNDPIRLYHVTTQPNLEALKAGGIDPTISGEATWLSPYPDKQPAWHNVGGGSGYREGANVMPVYADIQTPLVMDTPEMIDWAQTAFAGGSREFPQYMHPDWRKALIDEGYDGIVYGGPKSKEYALHGLEIGQQPHRDEEILSLFPERQLKSAIGNGGEYDMEVPRLSEASGGSVDDALRVVREHHADGEAVGPVEEPRPLTIYRGNAPVADEAGGSGREPSPPAFSYMPMPESVERQATRQPAYNPAERTWSDAGSTEGERLTRALGVEGELPKGETFMSPQPSGWEKYMPQRVPGTFLKRTGEAFNENADAVSEGLKAVREGNYGAGALGMVGGALGAAISPLTGMERVLVRDPYLRITGNLKDAQAAEMAADVALTGGVRGMVTPFAKAGSLERMATQPWDRVRMPSPATAGAATAAGAMLAPEDAEASKLSKAMDVARMAIPRELSPLGFYSHGAEAARGLAQAKGTPQQFTSMLNTAGVRGPEMESYLQTFGGRPIVTRDEIAQHFQDTMPKITERVNYDEGVTGPDWTTTGGGTRFGEHALSGGGNYREVRMMLGSNRPPPLTSEEQSQLDIFRHLPYSQRTPEVVAQEAELVQRQRAYVAANLQNPDFTTSHWPGDPNVVAHLRMSDRTGPNGEKILHVEEIQSDWAQKARGLRDDEIMRVMKDKNLDWDEANKIVPSDFGFKPPADPMMQAKIDAAKKAAEEAGARHQNLVEQITNSFGGAPDRKMPPGEYARAYDDYMKRRSDALKSHPEFEPSLQQFRQANSELGNLREQQRAFANAEGVPIGPYVGKTPQWTDLALKRALKEAAEGGYDRVVFTPGAEQAKRWDLQHHVDNITWSAEPDGTYWVGATGKDGKPIPGLDNEPMTPRKLRETFGSDIAKKIMKGEGKPMVGGPELELSGLDLQTGEGMRSYYDKIVPKRLQELIKKHDPEAKVRPHEIPNTGEDRSRQIPTTLDMMNWHPAYANLSREEKLAEWNAMAPVNRRILINDYKKSLSDDVMGHGIDLTPEARESILRGQSAHARGGEVMKGEDMRDHYEGGGLTGAALKLVRKAVQKPPAKVGIFPQVAERYPEMVPPVPAIDKKTGKEFLAKTLSPEAVAVQKARIAAQKEINAGNYEPYFPLHERFDVDPSHYPEIQPNTRELVQMKSPKAVASYEEKARDPQAMENLKVGFEHGLKQKDMAENWYYMGQLEAEFIKEYGPEMGRTLFKQRFPDAMAATTGGADPTSNLMMAHFGNYLHNLGEKMPTKAYEYPFPVAGGKYGIQGNMDQYRKMIMEGEGLTPENPKRYNFSANFLGKKTPTIDEQMSSAWDPKMASPPTGSYGHYEGALTDLSNSMGYDPRYFQEVGWAGIKDMKTPGGFEAQPMIGIVNEAIERTHQITGMPRDEIVRRGLVRAEIPLYGAAGATAAGAMGPEFMQGQGEAPAPEAPVVEERRRGGSVVDRALMLVSKQA